MYWNARLRAWIVSRYSDVRAAFSDERLSSERLSTTYATRLDGADSEVHRPAFEVLSRWMVFLDAPRHENMRALVAPILSRDGVECLREHVESTVLELLNAMSASLRSGPTDFVHTFAAELPVRVICELLGVPHDDRHLVRMWSSDLSGLVFGALEDADRHRRARDSLVSMASYLRGLARGREPLAALLPEAPIEDLVATAILLLFGGHETTRDLLANGLLQLLRHPHEAGRLREDLSLMPSAIEELVRFDGPSKAMWRVATSDLLLEGQQLGSGDRVLLAQAGANRDPREFVHPNRLDLTRTPNHHLGFGFGPHECIGAALARMEASIAWQHLLERYPNLMLASQPLVWRPTIVTRSLRELHIQLG